MAIKVQKKLSQIKSLDELNIFTQGISPQIGKFGGRRFTHDCYDGSLSYNDLIRKAHQIFKNSIPVEYNAIDKKLTAGIILEKLKQLDSRSNKMLKRHPSTFVKVMTAVKRFFGNLFIDRKGILNSLNSIAHIDLSKVLVFGSTSGDLKKCKKIKLDFIDDIKIRKFPELPDDNVKIENKASEIQEVSSNEVLGLQSKLQNPNPKHALPQLETLAVGGVLPKYKMKVDNATYYFSDTFQFEGSHLGRIALVEVDGKVYPRVLYQSNSQATWRVLPAMAKGWLKHFGKGKMESDTQLPIEVNLALHTLPAKKKVTTIFAGAKDLVKTEWDFGQTWQEKVAVESFMGLKTDAPENFWNGGNLVPNPPNPKDIKLPEDPQILPDFSAPVKEKMINVPHYGDVTAKVFLSKDGNLKYLFYEAKDGRAFLASMEKVTRNPINEYGVRGEAPDPKNMDAPLLEYWQQIPKGYTPTTWGATRYESTKYTNNWNYVRELPLIQLYYKEQGRELPAKL